MKTLSHTSVMNPLYPLYDLIATQQDWLTYQVLDYAQRQGYTNDTSTLTNGWQPCILGLSASLLEVCRNNPQIVELGSHLDYDHDLIANYGFILAQGHRNRSNTLRVFLELMKYYRQSYLDLIDSGDFTLDQQQYFRLFINRFFDRIELGFCDEWERFTTEATQFTQKSCCLNNEGNKYLALFESLNEPVILFNEQNNIINLNHVAGKLFLNFDVNGGFDYGQQNPHLEIPWLKTQVIQFVNSFQLEKRIEILANTQIGERCFDVNFKKMLDTSQRFSGTIVICKDITTQKEEAEKLRISQINLAQTQHLGHIGNWSWDVLTGEIIWSDEIYQIFAQDKEQFKPTYNKLLKLIYSEDIEKLKQAEKRTFNQGEKYCLDYRIILPNSSIRWVHVEAIPNTDPQRKPLQLVGTLQDITNTKRVEQDLQIKELAIASSMSAIAIGDLEGNLTYINHAFLQMWGYEHQEEVLGQPFLKFWQIRKKAKEVISSISSSQDSHGHWLGELVGRRKDGSLFDAQVSANLVTNGEAVSICMIISVMDITQQKAAEISLKKLLRLYTNLTKVAPVGIFRADLQGNYIYANNKTCQIVGGSMEDLLGTGWSNYLYDEDRGKVIKEWTQAIHNKTTFRGEYRYQNQEGNLIWVLAQTIAEVDEQGEVISYVGTLTDITERKQAEEATNQINAEMQAIFDTFPDLFFRVNSEGIILDYRTHNESDLYALPSQFLGKKIQDVLPYPVGNKLCKAVRKTLKTQSLVSIEYYLTIEEQKTFFEARIVPFNDNQAIAIARNITTRKQVEIALRESEERLRTIIVNDPTGLIILDTHGKVIFVNPAAETLFGRTSEQLMGEILGIPIVINDFTEIAIPQPKGKLIIARMRFVKTIWEGKPTFLASLTDITDLKEAEEQLHILHQATEQSPVSIVITDADGNIEYVNPKFEEVTGYSKEEVLGNNPRILKTGNSSSEEYKLLWETISSGREWHGEFYNRKKNGELFWEAASISPIKNQEGMITHFVGIKEDITERKAQEATLAYQANYDALTGLPNRFLAMDRLRQCINQAERNKTRVAVMFIDLDHFKDVNDTLGHEYGDLLLQQASHRLLDSLRKSDTVARLGGDEFLVIIYDLEEVNQCKQIASKILLTLEKPFNLSGEEAFISASIGITIYPDDGNDVSLLMRNADAAMYKGKRGGRNDFKFYTAGMNEAAHHRLRLENFLRYAINKQELFVVYQPFIDLKCNRVVGAEALLRWRNPELGPVSPDQFIPIAEETGLITELGAWVLSQACQEAAFWQTPARSLWVAVNLSPRQFRDPNFLDVIIQAVERSGISTNCLELEITEKLLLEDVPGAKGLLDQLHHQNFRLSIDDFGTGYSSLSYLTKFPFQVLKIDRSFIANVPDNPEFVGLVKTIIAMGHGLNLKVVAEGVETEAQARFLLSEGCDYAQGYFFSRPIESAEFRHYLSVADKTLSLFHQS